MSCFLFSNLHTMWSLYYSVPYLKHARCHQCCKQNISMMSKLMSINIIYNKELHTKTSVLCTDHMIKIKQMLGPRIRSLLFQQLIFSTVSTHVHWWALVGRLASPRQGILSFWRSSTTYGWNCKITWLGIYKSSKVLCWSSN